MALHLVALAIVLDAALGAWLGVVVFFSFVGAPRAFAVFGDRGGEYVGDVFPRYYRVGVGLGIVAFLAGLLRASILGYPAAAVAVVALAGVAVVLAGHSLRVLVPRMAAAGDDGFHRHHRQSVVQNGVTLLAVASALVASHLPA